MYILRKKLRKIFHLTIVMWIGIMLPLVYAQDENSPAGDAKGEDFLYAKTAVRMRSEPNVTSKQIGLVPEMGEVKVLEKTGKQERIGHDSGEWLKVQYKDKTGYAFGAFFVKSKPPNFSDYKTTVNLSKYAGSYTLFVPPNEEVTCRLPRLYVEKKIIIISDPCGGDDRAHFCLIKSKDGSVFTCYEDYVLDDYFLEKYELSENIKEKADKEMTVEFSSKSVLVNDHEKFVR